MLISFVVDFVHFLCFVRRCLQLTASSQVLGGQQQEDQEKSAPPATRGVCGGGGASARGRQCGRAPGGGGGHSAEELCLRGSAAGSLVVLHLAERRAAEAERAPAGLGPGRCPRPGPGVGLCGAWPRHRCQRAADRSAGKGASACLYKLLIFVCLMRVCLRVSVIDCDFVIYLLSKPSN